jgi:hypothetical protein
MGPRALGCRDQRGEPQAGSEPEKSGGSFRLASRGGLADRQRPEQRETGMVQMELRIQAPTLRSRMSQARVFCLLRC